MSPRAIGVIFRCLRAPVAYWGVILTMSIASAWGQVPRGAATPGATPPWRRVLKGDDARRVGALKATLAGLEKADRFAEAVAPAGEILAIRRRAQGDDHWETIDARIKEQTCARMAGLPRQDLSDLAAAYRYSEEAIPLDDAGRYAEAERLYRDHVAIYRRVLGEDHPYTAEGYNNLAFDLDAQGKYTEAEALYQKVVATFSRALGEDHPYTATGCNNLALDLQHAGKYAEAELVYQRALAIRLRILAADHVDLAQSYNNLGSNLFSQGKYAEAEPLFQRALAIRRRAQGDNHRDTAGCYNNLAAILNAQGKYAEAESLYEKALAIARDRQGEDHPDTASYYNNLAHNLKLQRKYAQAESLYQKALAVNVRVLREEHPATARIYNNLAGVWRAQGKYAESSTLYQKALDIRHRALGEEHPETAESYDNLATNLQVQDKYAEAEPLYRAALVIRRRVLGEEHRLTTLTYDNLTLNLSAQGKYTEAEVMADAATRSFEAARLRISFAGLDRSTFGAELSPAPMLAVLKARSGRGPGAWQDWEASLARGLFDELAARRRRPLTPGERGRQEDLLGQLNRLDGQITVLASERAVPEDRLKRLDDLRGQRLGLQGQLTQFEAELVKKYQVAAGAVYSLDRIQSQLPDDAALVGWLDLKTRPDAADPLGNHWACVVRRTGAPTWLRLAGTGPNRAWTSGDDDRPGQVRQMMSDGDSTNWQGTLAEMAEQRLGPLELELQSRGNLPAVRHLVVLPSPVLAGVPIEALMEARPEGAPRYLVSYAPSGTIFAWLRERRGEARDRPAQPRRLLALGNPIPPPMVQADELAAKPPDHGVLVRVVQPGSNAADAGIQPGDVLLRYAGAEPAGLDDLRKLIQSGGLKAAGRDATVWRDGRILDLKVKPGPLGVSLEVKPAAEAILAQRKADTLLRRARGSSFQRLPGSKREVEAIAGLFDPSNTATYLGSVASEQTLDSLRVTGELGRFSVIHLATHGKMDDAIPMNSRLLLSQDRLPDPAAVSSPDQPFYDGSITAGEVMGTWKLNADLVVLSACRSGLGRDGGGEGFIGFAQAFFLAGSRSLVLSLWDVDDRATSLLMVRFYRNWLGQRPGLEGPLPKAEALREAKAWLRGLASEAMEAELTGLSRGEVHEKASKPMAAHPFAHPHYWAGFVLIGDPD
jgi:tetratricopeptide (TPR) repeat protein